MKRARSAIARRLPRAWMLGVLSAALENAPHERAELCVVDGYVLRAYLKRRDADLR